MACRVIFSSRLLRLRRDLGRRRFHVSSLAPSAAPRLFAHPSRLPSSCEVCASRSGRWGGRGSRYSTTSSTSGDGGDGESGEEGGEEGEEEEVVGGVHQQYALAPISVPDTFPEVPVLPISRNPIFPKFVKMLEVRGHIGFHGD